MNAHPEDILFVGAYAEAENYPQFAKRQVFSARSPAVLAGRRFRTAYYTDAALATPVKKAWRALRNSAAISASTVTHIKNFEKENTNVESVQEAHSVV